MNKALSDVFSHGQSIERRITFYFCIFFNKRSYFKQVTTSADKYADRISTNYFFIDLEGGKVSLTFLLATIYEKKFASYVFPDKNQKPLFMTRTQITNKRGPFCH